MSKIKNKKSLIAEILDSPSNQLRLTIIGLRRRRQNQLVKEVRAGRPARIMGKRMDENITKKWGEGQAKALTH